VTDIQGTSRAIARKMKSSGYGRDRLDWYVEPSWIWRSLPDCLPADLWSEVVGNVIWDPWCGQETVATSLKLSGVPEGHIISTDLVARGPNAPPPAMTGLDWLGKVRDDFTIEGSVIGNPPYGNCIEHITRAIERATILVATVVRLDFLASQARYKVFKEHPPYMVIVLSKRPSMPPGEKLLEGTKAAGGQHDYCIMVWRPKHPPSDTIIRWWMP